MASKYLPKDLTGKAKGFFNWLTHPWTVTGPTATSEFLESVPLAKDYRVHAPATQPLTPAIPQADADKVFDIKYYTRDRRRHVVRTIAEVEPSKYAGELEGLPPTPGKVWVMGKQYHIDDTPGDGYQK